jgi:DNA-binding response OmpR family regulator
MRLLASGPVDLIVVDLNGKTLGVLDNLRDPDAVGIATASDTPVIALTGGQDELARVRLLERGCDDVIARPFSYVELRARIAAVLRRTAPRLAHPVTSVGPVRIDHRRRVVTVDGRVVQLSGTEYRLLCALASDPDRVFSREQLLRDVWGYATLGATRTVDSHAARLRRKLANDSQRLVICAWGLGYRLIEPVQPAA